MATSIFEAFSKLTGILRPQIRTCYNTLTQKKTLCVWKINRYFVACAWFLLRMARNTATSGVEVPLSHAVTAEAATRNEWKDYPEGSIYYCAQYGTVSIRFNQLYEDIEQGNTFTPHRTHHSLEIFFSHFVRNTCLMVHWPVTSFV